MRELVSVIVLSYKNIDGIYETVQSILKQDYENIEIIIADDATPDFADHKGKIEGYVAENQRDNIKNFVFNIQPVNVGTVKNINSAIERAQGKYVKLISSEDCLNAPDVLTKYVKFMEENNYLIAFSKMRGVTPDGEYRYSLASCESNYDLLKSLNQEQTLNRLFKRDFLPAPASFIDVELFKTQGLFKEDTRLIEDYPYWIHLTRNGVAFGYIDDVLIDYKLSNSGAGNYSEAFMNDMFAIYDKYIFPYDKRFGILQPVYNKLKRMGLEFYMAKARWNKMNTKQKVIASIKYFPFYVLVELQKFKTNLENKKK